MTVELLLLPGEQLERVEPQLLQVYRSAFATPPYSESEADIKRFARSLRLHAERDDFRCCMAKDQDIVVGFAYGYRSEAGQWWHDTVARAMTPQMVEAWLDDAFEFVVLAVVPERQGEGIGGRLHDALLDGVTFGKAILSTSQTETTGLQLYRKRGWAPLLENFQFPGGRAPFLLMGLDLRQRGGVSHG